MVEISIAVMRMSGESDEQHIARVRQLSLDAAAAYFEADRALAAARLALALARKRGAHPEEIYELMDSLSVAAKAKGRARYRKESAEYAFIEVVLPTR